MHEEIKLLALDMDGTTHHKIGGIIQTNVEPIKQAIKKGVKVVFVTGRPVLAEKNELSINGLDKVHAIILGCNAGCIYDLKSKEILCSNPIDALSAKQVFELGKANNVLVWGYTTDLNQVVLSDPLKNPTDWTNENIFFNGEHILYDQVKDDFNFEFFKILIFKGNMSLFKTIEKEINLNVASSDGEIAEINKFGINKAHGLQWLSKYFNIPLKNMAAIGDGMNDYGMIKLAGVGVAIKNSIDAVKAIADVYIDKTNTQGAVKEFIEEYILKEK